MRVLLHEAQPLSNGEIVCMRPLTLRQQFREFFGVREEGSQLVEMAVVAPLLLIILTGLTSFGMAIYSQQQLGLATANAVQAVATGATIIADPCLSVTNAVSGSLPGWNAAKINYTLNIYTTGSTLAWTQSWTGSGYTESSCTGSGSGTAESVLQSNAALFQPLTLNVSYPYNWFAIFAWSNYGSTFKTPTGNLQTTQAAMIQ